MTFFINADNADDTEIFNSEDWYIRKGSGSGDKYGVCIGTRVLAEIDNASFKKIQTTLRSKHVRIIYITSKGNVTFEYN